MMPRWSPVAFLALALLGGAGIALHFASERAAYAGSVDAEVWAPTYVVAAGAAGRVTSWTPPTAGVPVRAGERIGTVQGPAGTVVLRAPHRGVLAGDYGYVGALVQGGQELARIADMRRVYVLCYMLETSARHLKVGESAQVRFAGSGKSVGGTVGRVYPAVAAITWPLPPLATGAFSKTAQWVPVRIDFPAGAQVPRYLGMTASVRIAIGGGGS